MGDPVLKAEEVKALVLPSLLHQRRMKEEELNLEVLGCSSFVTFQLFGRERAKVEQSIWELVDQTQPNEEDPEEGWELPPPG
jgi:hypothetical protein